MMITKIVVGSVGLNEPPEEAPKGKIGASCPIGADPQDTDVQVVGGLDDCQHPGPGVGGGTEHVV